MELSTLLFEKGGPQHTAATLRIALERAKALGIKQVVVASSHGSTAKEAQALFAPEGIRLCAVSISHGWSSLGWCMKPEEREELEALGITVVTGLHALSDGVGTAFAEKYGGRPTEEIVRDVLYRFSQGMKVAVECLLMAADAGWVDMESEVIAIAGTDFGADTAIVCKPAYPRTFLELEIREILAKPRTR
ncbi:MAG: pyruvate kinase alpha/beta domain-containing protein [Anaerolineae bacterium]|jgi:hypothetical protein|nr:hypothetical protein [Chloroflexota bacterium]